MSIMPAYLGNIDKMGLKVISFFLGSYGTDFDTHQGVVLLFETERG